MYRFLIKHVVSLCIGCFLAYLSFGTVDYETLSDYAKTLLAISVAVFTLAGIWVAYIYPQAIAVFTDNDKVSFLKGGDLTEGVEKLVLIMITSASSIACILAISFFAFSGSLIIKTLPLIEILEKSLLAIGVILLTYFSFLQFYSIFSVISRNITFVNIMHKFKSKQKAELDLQ